MVIVRGPQNKGASGQKKWYKGLVKGELEERGTWGGFESAEENVRDVGFRDFAIAVVLSVVVSMRM